MNFARAGRVLRGELSHNLRRPLFWVWLVCLALTAWGLSSGQVRIASGGAQVGGTKAWITSEYAAAMMLSMVIFLFYMFFIAIASGMAVLRDQELRVGEILHTTPLTPGEYIWGKFSAGMLCYLVVLALHLAFTILFNHVVPNPVADEVRGPFDLWNYLRPALAFGLPAIVFFAGSSFAIGIWTRRAILIFFVPVAAVLICGFFLWDWSPHWLSPRINRILMLVEPSGFRWLNETWLKLDRGADYYNSARVGYDLGFLASRFAYVLVGLAFVVAAQRRFARTLRGVPRPSRRSLRRETAQATTAPARQISLRELGMQVAGIGWLRSLIGVARFEAKELWSSPGLYLFIPIILIQIIGTAVEQLGAFDTRLLNTSGSMAVSTMNTITLLICLLLLFYTVESLLRERNTGLDALVYASPVRSSVLLLGKAIANTYVALVILVASFLGCAIALLIQGKVGIELWPFFVSWIVLLVPTFLVWSTFVMAAVAATGNRYSAFAVGLGVLIWTGYRQGRGKMSWLTNWDLWRVERWSDFGTFELNREALLWNRLFVLAMVPLFLVIAIRLLDRRRRDATRTVHRLRPASLWRYGLRLLPFLLPVLLVGYQVHRMVIDGFQGKRVEKKDEDYWKANYATWIDAKLPSLEHVDMELVLDPPRRSLRSSGELLLVNREAEPLHAVPVTALSAWDSLQWTLDGATFEPVEKSGLHVFHFARALEPGDRVRIGWSGRRRTPHGATKNGGGTEEFVLPSSVVLTSFSDSFLPMLGFDETVGIDDDNRLEPKEYPDDFHQGITPAASGMDPFTVRIQIEGPEEFTLNSVGVLVSERVEAGRRTVVWETDHPVNFFNVVAGRWEKRVGEGTEIHYLPEHAYNIDEMIETFDASRRWFSEWFYEYPWQNLKLSEFSNQASYAQGFPTNITFSEGIGFLTRSDAKANAVFLVTAHEAAHQWWGNILMPGDGPGGNILSEGMAHFSTMLLFEQVKGEKDRIGFATGIEHRYGDRRQLDSERPLVKIDDSRPGDTTVTYDKSGWVFWMLLQLMGREQGLAGYRDFIHRYASGPDHALLQDFVAVMREHAPDVDAFDQFVQQWFFEVVIPEYEVLSASKSVDAEGWKLRCEVRNRGTGRMPVVIAAERGERFPGEDASDPDEYRSARETVELGPDEQIEVEIVCDFDPERVVVDPDAMVLQLERKKAQRPISGSTRIPGAR